MVPWRGEQAETGRHGQRVVAGAHAEAGQQGGHVVVDGPLGEVEAGRDLGVGRALGQQRQHLELAVGELAIVVAVSGVHRGEAFQTAAQLVTEVKHRLPVWKRQIFDDGTEEWVACP